MYCVCIITVLPFQMSVHIILPLLTAMNLFLVGFMMRFLVNVSSEDAQEGGRYFLHWLIALKIAKVRKEKISKL